MYRSCAVIKIVMKYALDTTKYNYSNYNLPIQHLISNTLSLKEKQNNFAFTINLFYSCNVNLLGIL